jgi:hypothetical protein
MKKVLVFCSDWMYDFSYLSKWIVYGNSQEELAGRDNKYTHHASKFDDTYSAAIVELQPDYVLAICVGCTEKQFDAMDKPKGPTYITWSTDSYNHTQRCETSDLHLTSIPDAATKDDNFVPLFFEHHQRPRLNRRHKIGICARPHKLGNRQMILEDIKNRGLDIRINQQNLKPQDYITEIRNYDFGLNIPIYPNGLPNFRSFELGACGVMPVCKRQEFDLDRLFHGNIALYDELDERFLSVLEPYDCFALQEYYNRHHSLYARIEYILHHYYGESFE